MKAYVVTGEESGRVYLLGIASSPEAAGLIGSAWTDRAGRSVNVSKAFDVNAEMRPEQIGTASATFTHNHGLGSAVAVEGWTRNSDIGWLNPTVRAACPACRALD